MLALADGTVLTGVGCGAAERAVGEVCFNTAMTGYQEILTDPSYMAQIVCFTFPHIGNVGTNAEDLEQVAGGVRTAAQEGAIFRELPTPAANWRADGDSNAWLERRGVIRLAGVDTQALTRAVRRRGMPHAVIAHAARRAGSISTDSSSAPPPGPGSRARTSPRTPLAARPPTGARGPGPGRTATPDRAAKCRSVVVDYGVKRNILRQLTAIGAEVAVVPARTPAAEILARRPDGVVLSNGPGDPAATAEHAAPDVQPLLEAAFR